MAAFSELSGRDVLLPCLVGDDQSDLRMLAQHLDRLVGARVVIGDDRVDMLAEIVERIGKDQRLVADARDGNQIVLLADQVLVAFDESL